MAMYRLYRPLCFALTAGFLASCASSEVATFASQSPQEISAQVAIDRDGDRVIFKAPRINTRTSYGEFSKGMLTGGADFSKAVLLQGEQTADGATTHWLVAEVVYTNLGGVYRSYDRAGIEGIINLTVEPVSSDRHFTVNSANMTEVVKIAVTDPDLRARATSGFELRLADDSDNLAELDVPANYIRGYLLAIGGENESSLQ